MVRLKSGGVPMAVSEVNDDGALCHWQDAKGNHKKERFKTAVLEIDDSGGVPVAFV